MRKILTSALLLITSLNSFSQDYLPETQSTTIESYLKNGYRGFVSGETMIGHMLGIEMTTTHGAQLNDKIFVGGGVGMCIAENFNEKFANFPVYADFRADFVDKKVSPFLETKFGLEFAVQGNSGLYCDMSIGCRVKRFSISVGANMMSGEEKLSDFGSYQGMYWEEYTPIRAFNVVTRLAFEFR